jgi:hypothetical protein
VDVRSGGSWLLGWDLRVDVRRGGGWLLGWRLRVDVRRGGGWLLGWRLRVDVWSGGGQRGRRGGVEELDVAFGKEAKRVDLVGQVGPHCSAHDLPRLRLDGHAAGVTCEHLVHLGSKGGVDLWWGVRDPASIEG